MVDEDMAVDLPEHEFAAVTVTGEIVFRQILRRPLLWECSPPQRCFDGERP
jgi:hypothetical protein